MDDKLSKGFLEIFCHGTCLNDKNISKFTKINQNMLQMSQPIYIIRYLLSLLNNIFFEF